MCIHSSLCFCTVLLLILILLSSSYTWHTAASIKAMLYQQGIEHQPGPVEDMLTTLDCFGVDSDDSMWDGLDSPSVAVVDSDGSVEIVDVSPTMNTYSDSHYTKLYDLAHEADEVITDDEAISVYSSDSEMEFSDDENLTYQPQPPSYGHVYSHPTPSTDPNTTNDSNLFTLLTANVRALPPRWKQICTWAFHVVCLQETNIDSSKLPFFQRVFFF